MIRLVTARVRDALVATVDRLPWAADAVRRSAVRAASLLGADRRILAEARRPDLALDRALQLVQWTLAVRHRARFPRHFSPGDHLSDPAARAAALDALRRLGDPPAEIARQTIGLDDQVSLRELGAAIEDDLLGALDRRARRAQRGTGIPTSVQETIIAEATAALAAMRIRPFLMSGTLLGIIRDGEFMAHDYDVDLGLLPGNDIESARQALDGSPTFAAEVRHDRVVAEHTSGATLDVFLHVERDGLYWHRTEIHEWWNTPFDLVDHDVGDRTYLIPDDPERYLDENYGSWRRPAPFYDISFDTPNRRYRHDPAALRFLHSRCVQAIDRGDRWLLESAARELREAFGVDVTGACAPSPLLDTANREDRP